MKMKLVLVFCITFIGYVNCNCGIPRREPDSPEKLKEEYLDMVLRRNGDFDEPYRRPFCTEEEQILWSFRGILITMPSDLKSEMLSARKKGLPWEPYVAQMTEKKVAPVSPKPVRCGLLRRKQKPHKQVMEDYLDLVLQNGERLVRPPCRPFCIEEEQIMWLLRRKLETMSSQLKSDILDARRNKRPWLKLLQPKRKSTEAPTTIRTTTTKKPTTIRTTTTKKPTTARSTTTEKPTTISTKPVYPSSTQATTTTSTTTITTKPTTMSSTLNSEKEIESSTTLKMTPTDVSSGAKSRRESGISETMKFLTTSSVTSAILKSTSSTAAPITPSSTIPSSTTLSTAIPSSTTSAMMKATILEYTPEVGGRFGGIDTFETSDMVTLLTATSRPVDVIDKPTSTVKATTVIGVSSTTVATTSMKDMSSSRSPIISMTDISSTKPGIASITNTSITVLETTTEATTTAFSVDPCFDPSELYDLTKNSVDIPMHAMMKTKRPGCKR